MKTDKLILIEWLDAMSDTDGWRTLDDAIEWGHNVPDKIDQVGYIIHEDKEFYLLANKVNDDLVQGLTKIPKKYVIQKYYLQDNITNAIIKANENRK